jgi:DNA invertase Pin-like site-specific DNA recombinase
MKNKIPGYNLDFQIASDLTRPKIVAIYIRVSKLDQHPENQEIELKQYAQSRSYDIFDIYEDRISGAKDTRPGLDRLMQDARAGRFKTVIVWKIDRLGRSVAHMVQVIQEWENLGIDFIITTLGVDTRTPVGKLVLGVLMQIAEFERELIKERINLGLARARKQGKQLGRPEGSKDKKRRRTSGYIQRWGKQSSPQNFKDLVKENQ